MPPPLQQVSYSLTGDCKSTCRL